MVQSDSTRREDNSITNECCNTLLYRHLQLTATDIRRTTALLLKTSLNRNSSATRRQTVPYPEPENCDSNRETVMASVGATLAQLMGPKSSSYRTKPKIDTTLPASPKTQSVISAETVTQLEGRWKIPRYH